MRRIMTIAILLIAPMLAGCCNCCGYRLFCRPCMFGRGCGCGVGGGMSQGCGCSNCNGSGSFYPAGTSMPAGTSGPIITTPAPPPASGTQIEKLSSAQAIPTKVLR
jgi:hypothetical protein